MESLSRALIVSITPYFLERDCFWFQENLNKILEAQRTQSFFQDNVLYVEKNQSFNLSNFLRRLDEMGYEKVQTAELPGEFSQQGGVIDVFPINLLQAIRFDFLGNKIDAIEKIDVKIGDEKKSREILKKKLKSQKLFSDLKGLKSGDYLVHLDHGIGRFCGNQRFQFQDSEKDYYILEYDAGDKLYVPFGLERKLSRYVGFSEPHISRLSSPFWQTTKKKIKEEAEKLAKELLEIYARRQVAARSPYLPDDEFDFQLASSFKYEETPDQNEAIEDIKKDLEKTKPMDRIVCGDVGFGKTEVALRAMMKVVKSGYQAIMLCPTTILANQHFQNFRNRLEKMPIKMEILTRLQTENEQREIVEKLKENKIDIVIGTHRLLSEDVASHLFQKEGKGLLVIDDEQRFGVKQKEKLKQLRSKIDILSLSATPIPRTLHLVLSSLKNVSLIQTPPAGRLPVKTFILPKSSKIIRSAIENELSRKGQIYYLYNKVETIEIIRRKIQQLTPSAKIGIIHGRMPEKDLIKIMENFQNKRIDVLIATTIIENGLDFPNVNTLVVDDASRLGLSQAYQIRGRIGRSHIKAFAYFLHGKHLSEKAQLRMNALKEAEELGSGYRVALRDLEIRGAGNILGQEQSGSINKVGLNLYCQMLSDAVERLRY